MLMQAALPHLKACNGNIVNVSSVAGNAPQPYSVAYAAAKGGLTMMTRSLALELTPHNVRVNAICPGTVATPLVDAVAATFPSDLEPRLMERIFGCCPARPSPRRSLAPRSAISLRRPRE